MVLHETKQRAADVIAEAAALGVGGLEATLNEAQGELLCEILGHGGVANGAEQIAEDSAAVALHQLLTGGRLAVTAGVSGAEHGPVGGDLTEGLLQVVVAHGRLLCGI